MEQISQIGQVLQALMIPDPVIRPQAEQQLGVLAQQPGILENFTLIFSRDSSSCCTLSVGTKDSFGVSMAQIALNPQVAGHLRQLASILLKQYVKNHWDHQDEHFQAPEIPKEDKQAIKELLPRGLSDPVSKIRTAIAMAIASIAHWEWPEHWPTLITDLVRCLSSGDQNLVTGAIRCLEMFASGDNFSDQHLPLLVEFLFPTLIQILSSPQTYSERIRMHAVGIFFACVEWLDVLQETHPAAVKKVLLPVVPKMLEIFQPLLQQQDSAASHSGLKINIMDTLTQLIGSFPKLTAKLIAPLLMPIWGSLINCLQLYEKSAVYEDLLGDAEQDTDGEVLGFERLVLSLLEFMHQMMEMKETRKLFPVTELQNLCYLIIGYMQLTKSAEELWASDPNEFAADEEDEVENLDPRKSSIALLQELVNHFGEPAVVAVFNAAMRRIFDSEQLRRTGAAQWWKIREAALLAVGSVGVDFSSQVGVNVNAFIGEVLAKDSADSCPQLRAKALWCASQLGPELLGDSTSGFLESALNALNPNRPEPLPVRVQAAKAVGNFHARLPSAQTVRYVAAAIVSLIHLLPQANEEVIPIILDALVIVVETNSEESCKFEEQISAVVGSLWTKYVNNPFIVCTLVEIVKGLAQTPGSLAALHGRFMPHFAAVFAQPTAESGITEASLDMLCGLMYFAPPALARRALDLAFAPLIHLMLNTQESGVMLSGSSCLKAFVRAANKQLAEWRDPSGKSGVEMLVSVIGRLLQPDVSDTAAAQVGGLISRLLLTLSESLGPLFPLILKAVVDRLATARELNLKQSLLMVFARLIQFDPAGVLNFLATQSVTIDTNGTSMNAMHYVITLWVKEHEDFQGDYYIKISTVALTKLYQTQDERVLALQVPGARVVVNDGRSSRRAPQQLQETFTQIPLREKLLLLLRDDYQAVVDERTGNVDEGEESDDEEDEEEDSGNSYLQSIAGGSFAPAEAYQSFIEQLQAMKQDTIDEEDDPDIKEDPLYQMNLEEFLRNFFISIGQPPPPVQTNK